MRIRSGWVRGGCALLAALGMAASAQAAPQVIVNDSWADGDRADTVGDALDSNWWTSSNINGIEDSIGSLGMVTGGSGRGIHTVFPTQTLGIGDKLVATYTFTTPNTVGPGGAAAFKVGLYDTLGRSGLNADITSNSTNPSALYGWGTGASPPGPGTAGLPGYMLDMDVVTTATGPEDLNFRQHDAGTVGPTGRLMGTTTGFANISPSGPDAGYVFAGGTTYSGSLTLTRLDATTMEIAGTLTTPAGTATHSVTDAFDSVSYGMLAFWANSNTFGASLATTPDTPDNGIDFSNVTITFVPVPEPSSMALLAMGLGFVARRRR